uniref:Morc S5 domain-containing protein n=1 Tax=Vitis vinifera TaxID=29760 RepID=F6HUX5_VITVI
MSDQDSTSMDESSLFSATVVCPAPVCRQFWKAGNYDIGHGSKATNVKNHLCVHPMFLHSNATSHKWAFGAIAELLDNAFDEIQNGATFVVIDKIPNPRDGNPALLIQDDGGGMDPEAIRHCMSFGFSAKKSKTSIGQYGNGFKTSTMRLGADVIVFSRHLKERSPTQSIGLLSYTFLRQTGCNKIVVPVVDYEFNASTGKYGPILPHGKKHFSLNLSMLLQWSPYSTEDELLLQFDDIGQHGTKIVIYNLWLNDEGHMELDFDSDVEDICINRGPKLFQKGKHVNPIYDQHMANLYHYSLRIYSSILYLRIPQCFRIILRGRVVEHHNIANDLKFWEIILYRPHIGGNVEVPVLTTIGFLKDAPHVNIHGFNVYHRNRLILPFWRVVKNTTNSNARGVVGVLEANFIEPTHNKQDFEKTSLFQRLEDRLKQMTMEYWDSHCELIGYQQVKKTRAPVPSQESLYSRTHGCSEPVLMNHSCHVVDSSKDASSAIGSFQFAGTTPPHVSARNPGKPVDSYQISSQQGLHTKWKQHKPPVELEHAKRHKGSGPDSTDILCNREEKAVSESQDQETLSIMQENEKLQSQLLEYEKTEQELNLKMQQLKRQLEDVRCEYAELLAESESLNSIEENG